MEDLYLSIRCVLQMAKAYQNLNMDAGFSPDQFDDEAIIAVERLLDDVENEDRSAA